MFLLSHGGLCNPTSCGPPGSSINGTFQARILEWVAISYCRGSSRPRDWTCVSDIPCTSRQIPYHCTTRETRSSQYTSITLLHLNPNHPEFSHMHGHLIVNSKFQSNNWIGKTCIHNNPKYICLDETQMLWKVAKTCSRNGQTCF